jgi:hypothetical protein
MRRCGIAVFSVPNLVTAAVKNVKATSANSDLIRKWKHLVGLLLKLHHPNVVVIEKLGGMRESPSLRGLVNAIKALARRMGIILVEYSLELVRDLLIPFGLDHTKAMLCRLLASQFPDLQQYESRVKRTIGDTEPYFVSLFMAVALGLT